MSAWRRARSRRSLGSLAAITALACCALSGCSHSVLVNDPSVTKDTIVCAAVSSVDRLVITRSSAKSARFTFPAEITVTEPRRVRDMARALCALPVMPSGTFHCPPEFAISYRLIFAVGERTLKPVIVLPSGCQEVYGLGRVRWVALSPGFWPIMGATMGIPHPRYATLRGPIT